MAEGQSIAQDQEANARQFLKVSTFRMSMLFLAHLRLTGMPRRNVLWRRDREVLALSPRPKTTTILSSQMLYHSQCSVRRERAG